MGFEIKRTPTPCATPVSMQLYIEIPEVPVGEPYYWFSKNPMGVEICVGIKRLQTNKSSCNIQNSFLVNAIKWWIFHGYVGLRECRFSIYWLVDWFVEFLPRHTSSPSILSQIPLERKASTAKRVVQNDPKICKGNESFGDIPCSCLNPRLQYWKNTVSTFLFAALFMTVSVNHVDVNWCRHP